jgi:hypothetical protein
MRLFCGERPEPTTLIQLPQLEPETLRTVANIYTSMTGYLCLIVEDEGCYYAQITHIKVDIPPPLREASEKAAQIVGDKYYKCIQGKVQNGL